MGKSPKSEEASRPRSGRGKGQVDLIPDRVTATDMLMILLLGIVAMIGFRETFAGWWFLVAGVTGLVIGMLIAHVANVLKQPMVVTAVLTVLAFFLLGGALAIRGEGVLSALPIPRTLGALADQSIHGWKELLTTLPPVDSSPLVALPYLLGLIAGATVLSVATKFKRPLPPVLIMVALLAATILLGVQTPRATALIGCGFAVLALAWAVIRSRRVRRKTHFERRRNRQRALAVGLSLAAAGFAFVVGPNLPGVSDDRTVLRSHVVPPFDVGQYPSPLSSFRKYTDGVSEAASLEKKPLMHVEGVKPGTLVRFAALDDYDGTTWGAANDSRTESGPADTFQKVGSEIANPASGQAVDATIELAEGYKSVWLPTVGALKSITFESDRLKQNADDFRYNLATSTGVVPDGLQPGERFRFHAVLPKTDQVSEKGQMSNAPLVNSQAATAFQPDATRLGSGSDSQIGQVLSVARYLRDNGTFTHGGAGYEEYRSGNSSKRLKEFISPDGEPAGDDEQYAATMALLANQLGVPARVVVGAAVPADGTIRGSDVHAWVELRGQDGKWLTLPTDAFMSTERQPLSQKQKDPQLTPGITVPPPVPVRPPATVGDQANDSQSRKTADRSFWDFEIPWYVIAFLKYVGSPLLLIAAVLGVIVFYKSQRRKKRRTSGSADHRVANGYRELIDQARDLGHEAFKGRTRRESANDVGIDSYLVMARNADAHVFGSGDPSDADAADYWKDVDRIRSEVTSGLTKKRRWLAAISISSLKPLSESGGNE